MFSFYVLIFDTLRCWYKDVSSLGKEKSNKFNDLYKELPILHKGEQICNYKNSNNRETNKQKNSDSLSSGQRNWAVNSNLLL